MLDRRIRFSGRNVNTFGKELEMVNQFFHVLLHCNPRRRRNLMVIDYHRSRILAQPLNALLDDAVGLAKFLNSYQIPVIAVAIDPDRYVKIHPIVHFIRLFLPQIPFHPRTPQHRAGKAQCPGAFRRHHPNTYQTLFPDTIIGKQSLVLIDITWKPVGKIFDEIQQRALAVFVARPGGFFIVDFR